MTAIDELNAMLLPMRQRMSNLTSLQIEARERIDARIAEIAAEWGKVNINDEADLSGKTIESVESDHGSVSILLTDGTRMDFQIEGVCDDCWDSMCWEDNSPLLYNDAQFRKINDDSRILGTKLARTKAKVSAIEKTLRVLEEARDAQSN